MTADDDRERSEGGVAWLLLDVGGVLELVDDATWPGRFASRWSSVLGLTGEEFSDRLRRAGLPDAARRSGVADEYWSAFGSALDASELQCAAMRADFWDEYCGRANSELLGFLGGLRGRTRLAILSNSADGAREEEERRFGFAALFDPICYSHEIGVLKPDPAAFEIVLGRLDARPKTVLFIDDHIENIAAADALGFRTHHHVTTRGTIDAITRAIIDR